MPRWQECKLSVAFVPPSLRRQSSCTLSLISTQGLHIPGGPQSSMCSINPQYPLKCSHVGQYLTQHLIILHWNLFPHPYCLMAVFQSFLASFSAPIFSLLQLATSQLWSYATQHLVFHSCFLCFPPKASMLHYFICPRLHNQGSRVQISSHFHQKTLLIMDLTGSHSWLFN